MLILAFRSASLTAVFFDVLLLLGHVATATRKITPKDGISQASVSLVKNPMTVPQEVSIISLQAEMYIKTKRPMPAKLRQAWDQEVASRQRKKPSSRTLKYRDTGAVTNVSYGNYLFPITWGTPAKTFHVIFDTGSSDLWVWGWQMTEINNISLAHHNYYNASASSTAVALPGETFYQCYGSGCVYGNYMGYDTVTVDNLEIQGNPIPWITWEDVNYYDSNPGIDGILGLALSYNDAESPNPQQTWPSYVLPTLGPLEGFTTCLIYNGSGTINFGHIDTTEYYGNITYTPVTNPFSGWENWAFTFEGYQIGNSTYNATSYPVWTDSGAPSSNFPSGIIYAWIAATEGAYLTDGNSGYFLYPCLGGIPNFYFTVGGETFTIYGSLFEGGQYGVEAGTGIAYCQAGIYFGDESFVYAGLAIHESLFIVHDYGNMQMGFAKRHTGL